MSDASDNETAPPDAAQGGGAEAASSRKGPPGPAVQKMFAAIAPRYDRLNHILSLSIDRLWRRRLVRWMASMQPAHGDLCLDLCSGTGDLALEIGRRLGLETVAVDFCHPMLVRSSAKMRAADLARPIHLAEADAQLLPFADCSFRFVTVAFGVRNIETIEKGLLETLRVLRPGGALLILEFAKPRAPVLREVFGVYFTRVLPRLGSWLSGTEGPYQYLPDSVGAFPPQREFGRLIGSIGFEEVRFENLTGGIAAIHCAVKPAADGRTPSPSAVGYAGKSRSI